MTKMSTLPRSQIRTINYTCPLIPTAKNAEGVVDGIIGKVSEYQKTIRTMLTHDSRTVKREDMQYFGEDMWGKVPTYEQFMRALKGADEGLFSDIKYMEAEALGNRYEQELEEIFTKPTEEFDGSEGKRFKWGESLYKMQERKIDRLDKRRKEDGMAMGVDLAAKIIAALSDAELLRTKEIVDAEYSIAEGRHT